MRTQSKKMNLPVCFGRAYDVLMQALRYEKGMEEMEFQYGKSFQKRR